MLEGEGSSDLTDGPLPGQSVAIVAAHPDDEVIGAGGLLTKLRHPLLVHITDGAPRDGRDARAAGFDSCEDYAAARRRELLAALRLAGIEAERTYQIGLADQQACFSLSELPRQLAAMFTGTAPAVVLTHPYEGGHPDHDATAFAVHAAVQLMDRPPRLYEFTSYHAKDGRMTAGEFLGGGSTVMQLTPEERSLKQQMFDCFATQQQVLRLFPISVERFRPAPRYRFTEPPHAGPLHYERFEWSITAQQWILLAGRALQEMGLPDTL